MVVLKQNKTENALFQDFSCFFFTKSETIVLRGWVEGGGRRGTSSSAGYRSILRPIRVSILWNTSTSYLSGHIQKNQKVFGNSLGACLRVTRGP